jgi:hypothetical protein
VAGPADRFGRATISTVPFSLLSLTGSFTLLSNTLCI